MNILSRTDENVERVVGTENLLDAYLEAETLFGSLPITIPFETAKEFRSRMDRIIKARLGQPDLETGDIRPNLGQSLACEVSRVNTAIRLIGDKRLKTVDESSEVAALVLRINQHPRAIELNITI